MLNGVAEIFILEMAFVKANLAVFSNAKNYRRDPLLPLVVPTVNLRHFDVLTHQRKHYGLEKGLLVCNSNCAVIGIVIPFAALQAKLGLVDQMSVVTMQAVLAQDILASTAWTLSIMWCRSPLVRKTS